MNRSPRLYGACHARVDPDRAKYGYRLDQWSSAQLYWLNLQKLNSDLDSISAMRPSAKQLGDLGEAHAARLLRERGFEVTELEVNAPTYDLEVRRGSRSFFVSVKVSRSKQHVSLGSRKSVSRLTQGNFVFAFIPKAANEISEMVPSEYTLLILPADEVREESLRVHDAYWAARGGDKGYRVMVKGYGSHHREIWPRWMRYADAWSQLELVGD